MRSSVILALMLALVIWAGAPVMADYPFRVQVEPGTEADTWVYTIFNDSATANSIAWFDLFWDDPSWPDSWAILDSPPNWSPSVVWLDWPSWDCNADPGVPSAGNSLSGFVIESPLPALGFDIGYFILTELYYQDGCVELVPEPGTMLAMLGGLTGTAALIRRRRN